MLLFWEQADVLMDRLGKDAVFRKNYIDLWAKQKKELEEERGIISKPEHDSAARPAVSPTLHTISCTTSWQ